MGVIKRGILGGFSGKVANVVGTSWKGIAVMKSLPLSVSNPQTADQQAQRNAFTQVVKDAVILLSGYIKPLWDRFAQQQSGYNAFISANIGNYDASGIVDESLFILSRGQMEAVNPNTIGATGPASDVDVVWTPSAGGSLAQSTDEVFAAVYNEDKDEWAIDEAAPATRADGTITLNTPSSWASADQMHGYLAFRRDDGTIVSDTGYLSQAVG